MDSSCAGSIRGQGIWMTGRRGIRASLRIRRRMSRSRGIRRWTTDSPLRTSATLRRSMGHGSCRWGGACFAGQRRDVGAAVCRRVGSERHCDAAERLSRFRRSLAITRPAMGTRATLRVRSSIPIFSGKLYPKTPWAVVQSRRRLLRLYPGTFGNAGRDSLTGPGLADAGYFSGQECRAS